MASSSPLFFFLVTLIPTRKDSIARVFLGKDALVNVFLVDSWRSHISRDANNRAAACIILIIPALRSKHRKRQADDRLVTKVCTSMHITTQPL
jgi:hypothetical protein